MVEVPPEVLKEFTDALDLEVADWQQAVVKAMQARHGGPQNQLPKKSMRTKTYVKFVLKDGTCKPGQRADLTGCTPASGEAGTKPQSATGEGNGKPQKPEATQESTAPRKVKAPPGEKLEKAPCCLYKPDPATPDPETGVASHSRVGVPAMEAPPPPREIGRLPNLTDKERAVESRFADSFLKNADNMATEYRDLLKAGKVGDAPNIFNTDDAKLLSPDYNPQGVSDDDAKDHKSIYNVAVHQTANAIAKKAFLQHLDEVVSKLPEEQRTVLVTSGGVACHGRGTPIIMYDGSVCKVEDVKDGDQLMGPDSTPRTVQKTHKGCGLLYLVTPYRGDPFVVNGNHVLSLKAKVHENACTSLAEQRVQWSRSGVVWQQRMRNQVWSKEQSAALSTPTAHRTQEQQILVDEWKANKPKRQYKQFAYKVVNITVNEWLNRTRKFQRESVLYKAAGIEFPDHPVPLDPYFLGLWLGDGTHSLPAVTTADPEIADYLAEFVKGYPKLKLIVHDKNEGNKSKNYQLTLRHEVPHPKIQFGKGRGRQNPITEALYEIGVYKNKHIPQQYLINGRAARLQLLAGLIDSDGEYQGDHGFGFSSKYRHLALQVQFLARSLGFVATIRTSQMANPWTGKIGTYYSLYIGGNNLDEVPTKIARKQAKARPKYRTDGKRTRNALHTTCTIKPLGMGVFFGFTLDKDHLYLLGDFTVTHNSGKGYALANAPGASEVAKSVGAVWDAAGEQNATENPWVLQECKKRGIKPIFAFVHADPKSTWENPERGVVERAGKKGRMVDARLFSDSYALGAKNFQAFHDKNKDDPDVGFLFLDNTGKPKVVDKMPDNALKVDDNKLYNDAVQVLHDRRDKLKPAVLRGGTVGERIWGGPKKEEAKVSKKVVVKGKVKLSEVRQAERDWSYAMLQYGENNMATDRARMKYDDLREQYERQTGKPLNRMPKSLGGPPNNLPKS